MTPVPAFFLSSHLLFAVADGIPTVDVRKTCRLEAAGSNASAQDLDACIKDQLAARDELAKGWGKVSAADKEICLKMATKSYLPGYVELLTCVEMFQFAKMPSTESAMPSTVVPPGQRQPRARQ